MSEVQIFKNLEFKEVDGQLLFNAESVAKMIGLSRIAKSGNVVVRWERVNKYLGISTEMSKDNSCPEVGTGDFITEQQVYKIAIKANSQQAEKFQDWLTTEVLPSIRKTGGYQMKAPDDPMQQIVLIAQGTTKLDERVRKTENDIEFLKNDSPLPAGQYNKVGKMVSDAIHEYVKIHGLPSSAQGKLRKDISNQINSLAGIRTRTQLRIKDFEPVCQLIEHWVPTTVTRMQLQTELDMEAM